MASAYFIIMDRRRRATRQRIPRQFRDRTNPLTYMTDTELIARFRFPRRNLFDLFDLLHDSLDRKTERSHALPVHTQVMAALRFMAKKNFYSETADILGISKASVCRCIHSVVDVLCEMAPNFISEPKTESEIGVAKSGFYAISSFPNVIGCIDGTLIPIKCPIIDENVFVCRKGFHCLNIQAICDFRQKFINVVAEHPGSTNDAHIWKNCNLRIKFENGQYDNCLLLGDEGYPQLPYLMTPFGNKIKTKAQKNYERSQKSTRSSIERAFGNLKQRWRCLSKSGGVIQSDPIRCCKIIVACCVLHNMCIDLNVPLPTDIQDDELSEDSSENVYIGQQSIEGVEARNNLVKDWFNTN